jgi:1,4-dihydroxy-2-naphthoate polyprenyltransferase
MGAITAEVAKPSLKRIIQITRAPFFTAVIIPALLGTAVAWKEGVFSVWYLALVLLGVVTVNAGLNMSNDYFDHLSGGDELNHELTPFSGGSRTIQNGILAPRRVLIWSLTFYSLSAMVGLYLAATRGWGILAICLIGFFLAFFHNAPPIRIYHLAPGLGELAVAIGCGPLVVLGAYYAQTQRFGLHALIASIPMALLIAAVLCANEFPDSEADEHVGKKTLPVVLGKERAVWAYILIVAGAYASILVGVALGIFPIASLLGMLTLPLALQAMRRLKRYHSDTPELVPALAATVQLHLATGTLLLLGYLVARLLA